VTSEPETERPSPDPSSNEALVEKYGAVGRERIDAYVRQFARLGLLTR
jgi:hypothetical protein